MSRKPVEFRSFPASLVALAPFGPYRAIVKPDPRYDDGDTTWADVDRGWNDYGLRDMRLLGINAPERVTQAGKDARDYLLGLLTPNRPIVIDTEQDVEKYGRYLCAIFYDDAGVVKCANLDMVRAGHAVPYLSWAALLKKCETHGVGYGDLLGLDTD